VSRFCLICETSINHDGATCGAPACMARAGAWTLEIVPVGLRTTIGALVACTACGKATHPQRETGLCADCRAKARAKRDGVRRPQPRQASPCTRCERATYPDARRPGLCASCHSAARRHDLLCDVCGAAFTPRPYGRGALRCSDACKAKARLAGQARWRSDRRAGQMKPSTPAGLPCASCLHARTSRISETGYVCGIDAAMRCRPYGPATVYRHWEDAANG
jgi:hypothetical protein